jgi:ssDNA-binding Zn-finger/Zn-ribbon topoisomerase 1
MSATEKKQERERRERYLAEAERVVATGKCPLCGNTLYRNLALAGWWQCNGYPSPGFRKPGHENDLKCTFQIFTRS